MRLLMAHVVASYGWMLCYVLAFARAFVQRIDESGQPLGTITAFLIAFLLAPILAPFLLIAVPIVAIIDHRPVPSMYSVGLAAYMVVGAVVALRLSFVSEGMRRNHFGLCPTCGYDLRASPERCPECGAANSRAV